MITGKKSQGYDYTVDPETLKEWKFAKLIRRTESSDKGQRFLATVDLINFLLGEDQADQLSEQIAEQNDGRAPVDEMYKVVVEILDACKDQNVEIKK